MSDQSIEAATSDAELAARTPAGFRTSRRNVLAGGALIGSLLASNLGAVVNARADDNKTSDKDDGGANCFLPGTRIKTPRVYVAIEELQIGDLIETASGIAKPIKWIGERRIRRGSSGRWDAMVAPILIRKSAIAEGVPHRDVYTTANHCVYVGGLLIPATDLVNGKSIIRCTSYEASELHYLHIELSSHDILLADGLPTESLLVLTDRSGFDNHSEFIELYGDEPRNIAPFAEIHSYMGGRGELKSRLRSVIAPVYDRRQPLDIVRDNLAERADRQLAA